jgi:hypothetical protein
LRTDSPNLNLLLTYRADEHLTTERIIRVTNCPQCRSLPDHPCKGSAQPHEARRAQAHQLFEQTRKRLLVDGEQEALRRARRRAAGRQAKKRRDGLA